MEILNFIVEAALATGFIGYLVSLLWGWVRRPQLSICYDSGQSPNEQYRRGFVADPRTRLQSVAEYVARVRNDGRTIARSVEAAAVKTAWWDGDKWKAADYSPTPLVWSGTHDTRAHIPADGGERELALFVAGPLEGGQAHLHLARQSVYTSQTPPHPMIGPRRTRIRVEVTSEDGASASCVLELDWTPDDSLDLPIEGDCVR